MMYRGEDMDLRVPAARPTSMRGGLGDGDRLGAGSGGGGRWPRGDALWVDESVLACANNAYDLALAHGSAEVRLLHLVHALTRVEAAAQILETRGIREAHLRRESLDLILGEAPVGLGERGSPRRSHELEDVLRQASDHARRRMGEAAGVDDILTVLLNYPRDNAAVTLLRRHAPDWSRRERLTLPPEPRRPTPEPRPEPLLLAEPVASRLDQIEGTLRAIHAELAGDRRLLADAVRDLQRELMHQRGDAAAAVSGLAERLASLEHQITARIEAIRIPGQLADRLQSIEGAVHARASDTVRRLDPVIERLEAIERRVAAPVVQPAPVVELEPLVERVEALLPLVDRGEALGARIDALETAVRAGLGEGARNWAGLAQRLNGIESAVQRPPAPVMSLAPVVERLGAIEAALEKAAPPAPALLGPVLERLGTLERHLETRFTDSVRGWTALADRLQALEGQIKSQGGESQRQWSLLVDAFEETRKATVERAVDAPSDAAVGERLALVERAIRAGLGDTTRNVTLVAERLVAVEKALAAREPTEAALLLDERLRGLEAALEGRVRETGGRWLELTQRLDAIDRRMREVRSAPETTMAALPARIDPEVITAPVLGEVARLAQTAEARDQRHARSMGEIVGRIAALEQVVQANATTSHQTAQGLEGIIVELHKGMVQLGENQHTLASALKDWRDENKRDLGLISERLEPPASGRTPPAEAFVQLGGPARKDKGAEPARGAEGAVEMPQTAARAPVRSETVAASGPAAPTTGARQPPPVNGSGHGFWWWLFGTSNVRQANRDAEMRWQAMHQNLKATRERLRDRA